MEFVENIAAFVWNSYIRTVRPADILDIAVIAVIVYRIMVFVSRTGSARVIRGILFLVAAMWFATLLKLNTVNFLMGKTFEWGVLAIIVLFQPELRRLLERVGSSNITQIFGRTGNLKEIESAINQIVDAVSDLAKTQTGALIVFERNIKLDEPIKTGTIINANAQSELIRNVFYPNTPMHDGAMIIRDGRVIAAGCMLPLSNNPNLSRDLGMRHRAAIGMSETSDAIVAVVSEETGSLSVAVEGMLKRHLAIDTFETLLRIELLPQGQEGRSKTIFTKRIKRNGNGNEAENQKDWNK